MTATNVRRSHWPPAPRHAANGVAPETAEIPVQIAQVRVVIPMTEEQQSRLKAHLEQVVGRPVELQIRIDPEILGGVSVRMDDLVIDGSVRARLTALHDALCSYCLLPAGAGPVPNGTME